jgi:hypothetical protein
MDIQKIQQYKSSFDSIAQEICKTLGINVDDHFREVTKMIALAKGAQREVQADTIVFNNTLYQELLNYVK